MASDLIRKAAQPEYSSGFKEIDAETVTWSERLDLKEAALRALERNTDPLWLMSMLGVLGNTRDRDLRKLWIKSLATHLETLKLSNGIVYTILLALRDIEEPVFEGALSLSGHDVQRNVTEAFRYLERHGIIIPG